MAQLTSPIDSNGYSSHVKKSVLILNGSPVSGSNKLPVDASVQVDSMDVYAEMKTTTGADFYVTTSNVGDDTDTIAFDSVAANVVGGTLTLEMIQAVENKTQGWIYNTKGATVTNTSIVLDMTKQETGAPVPGATDEFEIVYRGTSRLTNDTQTTKITDGTSEIDVITNADVWQPGTTDLTGFGVYGYDSSNNIAKPLKLNSDGELMVDAEITMEEIRVGSEDDTSAKAHYLKTDASGQLINVEVIQSDAADLNMTEANSSSIKTAVELIDDSVYTDGTGTPSKGVAVMGSDGTNPQFISTDNTGAVNINDISGTISLPTGAATETTLALIEGKDFATETTLALIEGKDFATETTLALIEGKDFATSAKQDTIITSIQLIDDLPKTDDSAFTPASDKGVLMFGVNSSDSIDADDYGAIKINEFREQIIAGYDSINNAVRLYDISPYAAQKLNVTNLNAVTSATDGASVDVSDYKNKTVYVNVSVNTGAVTVTIEVSPDGTTWWTYDSKTYTSATGLDSWEIMSHHPYMRVTTSTHSNATVTAYITGRGE